jgi:hypothetical protein
MLRSAPSRIRFSVGMLGGVVLGASLFSWAYSLHVAANRYTWVTADTANGPKAETAELWHVSASCVRPYFVRALLRSKAELQAHYQQAPDEIRARLSPGATPYQSVEPAAWHPVESGRQKDIGLSNQDREYVASLQVKYAEWYAALFKLEIQANNWQQRLLDLADQTLVVSAASRNSFAAYSRGNTRLISPQGDFDGYLLTTLGLGGLPSDEQLSLKSDCVTVSLVKQSFGSADYLAKLWRWPVDCLAEFLLGVELLFISIFFAPIALWLETGDLAAVSRPIHNLANRFGAGIRTFDASVRNFDRNRFARGVLERFRHMRAVAAAGYRLNSPGKIRRWAATLTQSMPGMKSPASGQPHAAKQTGWQPPAADARGGSRRRCRVSRRG